MKKSLLVIFAFMLAPLVAHAQTPVEREIEQMGFKSVGFKIASSAKKPPVMVAVSEPKMEVDFTHKDVSILPNTMIDTNVTIHARITNLLSTPLNIGFVRVQSLPEFWTTSVCFGTNCYTHWVSAVDSSQVPWEPNESRELVLHVLTPPGAQGTGNVELTLFPTHTTDSIKVTYTVTMQDMPLTQCRSFWFRNPYAGEVTFKSLSIADPELFDTELTSDTEYPTSPGDPFKVTFCLKNPDGKLHSTQITIVTDSGSFTRDVSMQSPASSVAPVKDNASGIRIVSVSPNPATSSKSVEVNVESSRSANVSFSIVDLLGRELRTSHAMMSAGASSTKLSVEDLTMGSYIILIKEDGQIVDQTSFNIAR